MSVRAYRVDKPATLSKDCSFNVWHHTELVEFLSSDDAWTSESSGEMRALEVSIEKLEEAIKGLKDDTIETDSKEQKEDLIESLMKDLKWAKKHKQFYVMYECF